MTEEQKIDQRVFDLYDEYCHGRMDRREFLSRAATITIGGVSALWMAQALLPRYAEAQTVSFTDARMKGTYVEYPSPAGTSAKCPLPRPVWQALSVTRSASSCMPRISCSSSCPSLASSDASARPDSKGFSLLK